MEDHKNWSEGLVDIILGLPTDAVKDPGFCVKVGLAIAPKEMGRLGGLKGGPERARRLSPERRKEIAQKAARARWDKKIDEGIPPGMTARRSR